LSCRDGRDDGARLLRSDDARRANERIAERAEALRVVSRVPMLCECSDPGCEALFLVALDAYAAARADPLVYLTAPEHRIDGGMACQRLVDYWLQVRPGE
jgi:hypothetical protein